MESKIEVTERDAGQTNISNCLATVGRPRSAVWDHFLYVECLKKSICKIESCGIQVGGKFSTSSKRHLEKKHNEKWDEIQEAERQYRSEKEKKRT